MFRSFASNELFQHSVIMIRRKELHHEEYEQLMRPKVKPFDGVAFFTDIILFCT
jgi:hypothetical protein